ncbi:uncharacterized protein BJ212DRAFT_130119 [Suillus subaureus]|uniref:Uncharacterized protein n=1 Tax=Suillus subaureus TaxID=48587 RepID=A0A9P7EDI2_9AGAM|nr:uncharacterized protein BJ212DRAFT_130119 [Suillus subaureus]KAG1818221.1 hypothetical protein BJ212DRAFT_130119 [Suillus subaureus]
MIAVLQTLSNILWLLLSISITSLSSSTQGTRPHTSTDDHESPNHKESLQILHEMEDTTGIDAQALGAFQPGTGNAREKLQWHLRMPRLCQAAPPGDRGGVRRYLSPRLGRTIL